MADLITAEQLTARLTASGTPVPDDPSALIADASALVVHVARTDFAAGVPAVIVMVVAQMIRRALDNPGELTAENIGSYGWQAMGQMSSSGASLYVTRAERRLIREAAGRAAVIGIYGDTGLGDPLVEDDAV